MSFLINKTIAFYTVLVLSLITVSVSAQNKNSRPKNSSKELNMPPPAVVSPKELKNKPLVESGHLVTLEDAYNLAIRNNPSYKNINEQIIQSQTLIQSAWSMLLPNLSADGSIIRNKNEINISFPQFDPATGAIIGMDSITMQEKWQKHFGVTANITLFNARSIPLIKMAYNIVDQTDLKTLIAKNNLLFAVTSAYYQIADLKKLIGVFQENITIANEFLRMAKGRMAAGQSTKIDVMRANIKKLDAQKQLDDAIDSYETAKNSLAFLLGINGEYRLEDPKDILTDRQSIDELTKIAIKNRAEIKDAKLSVEIAEHSRRETLTKWIPKFDATWKVNMNSAAGFSGDKVNWMLIFGAKWSILEGGGRLAELKKRKSKIRVASNNLDQTILDIKKDVDKNYRKTISKKRNVDVSEQTVELANENHKMISAQYQVGMASSLDLMDAATELARKKIALVLARLQYDLSLLVLKNTIGEYNALAFEQK